MINKFIRSSVSIVLALSVMAPVATFANEGNAKSGLDFGARVNSFLRVPGFGAKADLETRGEIKAENKTIKVEARTDLKLKKATLSGMGATVNADGSFTVNGDNGKQVKITTTADTKIKNRNTTGVLADVKADVKVIVRGTWNDDKTVIATREIQIVDTTINPIRAWFKILFEAHVLAGTVSVISGNTVTVVAENNTAYTVDITNARIVGRNVFITELTSDIKVGDKLQIFGNISGTSISAEVVHDLTVAK